MPETTKLDEREEGSAETHDPGPGAHEDLAQPDERTALGQEPKSDPESESPSLPEPEVPSHPELEAPSELREEVSEELSAVPGDLLEAESEPSIDDFAESVVSGLEQAGIEIENGDYPLEANGEIPDSAEAYGLPEEPASFLAGEDAAPVEAYHLPGDQSGIPGDEEGFFAGWGGELNEEAQQQPEELLSHHTLSNIASARGDQETDSDDHSSKHDELADAVQSALFTIYGDTPATDTAPEKEPVPEGAYAAGAGWTTPQAVGTAEDNLSPQDVILNYFNYKSDAKSDEDRPSERFNSSAEYGSTSDIFKPRGEYDAGQPQGEWPAAEPHRDAYEGPPSYPVPAAGPATSQKGVAAASERESSRLLGAAAIGLVGGIAIAASLAVFVINSYGPGVLTAPPGSRASDAADAGYGRAFHASGEIDGARSTPLTPVSEPDSLAASDVIATPGQPSALAIAIKAEPSDQTLVSITGVPDGARLNAGVDAGGGNWLLPPERLNGLKINLPARTPETVLLGVQLLDSNVRTPLSEKKQFAIRVTPARPDPSTFIAPSQGNAPESAALAETPKPVQAAAPSFKTQTVPAAVAERLAQPEAQTQAGDLSFKTQTVGAPAFQPSPSAVQASLVPPSAPAAQPLSPSREWAFRKGGSQTEIEDLIREGNKRMREGDILEARQLYQKAVSLGDPEAALAMGRSYDPIYFARIEKKNAEPDAAKAFDWYRKAMDGGATQTAKVRIENLKHFLNE